MNTLSYLCKSEIKNTIIICLRSALPKQKNADTLKQTYSLLALG